MADTTAGESLDRNDEQTEQGAGEGAQDQANRDAPKFSERQFEHELAKRLKNERARFSDYDELKASAARLAEIEEANKTELEKALARAEAAEKAREQADAQARELALRAAIVGEAAKPNRKVADPDAAVTFLTGPDKDLLSLDDSGNPTDIATAMDLLLERRSYLVAQAGARGSADQGARPGAAANQLTQDDLRSMSSAEIVKAQAEGRLDSLLGAA